MSVSLKNQDRPGRVRQYLIVGVTVLLAFSMQACDSLVDVTDPDIVTPESLNSESGIATLRAGSLGDLAVAMSGSAAGHGATAGLIVMSGLMSDEYDYSGTFPTRREGDTRLVQNTNGTMNNIYGNLHRARAAAEATIDLASQFGGVPAIESEMQSIAGYSYVMFAETHCSGVSFSKVSASVPPETLNPRPYDCPVRNGEVRESVSGWKELTVPCVQIPSDASNVKHGLPEASNVWKFAG